MAERDKLRGKTRRISMLAVAAISLSALIGSARHTALHPRNGEPVGLEPFTEADAVDISDDRLLALPFNVKRGLFPLLSPVQKSNLIRAQLTRELHSGRFDEDQSAMIREAMAQATPEAYATERSTLDSAACRAFIAKAKTLFNPEDVSMFIGLGKHGSSEFSATNSRFDPRVAELSTLLGASVPLALMLQPNPPCTCNDTSVCDCDPPPTGISECNYGAKGCSYSAFGCGCFAIFECNGMCCDYEFPNICW